MMAPSPKKERSRYFQIGLTAFLVIAASMVFFFLLFRVKEIGAFFGQILGILSPILTGIAIAYILNPIMMAFEKQIRLLFEDRVRRPKRLDSVARGVSVGLALMVALLVLYILGNLIAPELYNSVVRMVETLPSQIEALIQQLGQIVENNATLTSIVEETTVQALDYMKKWLQTDLLNQANVIAEYLTVGIKGVYSFFMNTVIGVIVSVYLLMSKETFLGQLKKLLFAWVPTRPAALIVHTCGKVHEIFSGFIIGKVIDSCIIGVLCFLGLSILQIPYSLLVSVIVGCTNVIPVFGPFIGAIPSALIILLASPIHGLYFIIFIIVLQQIDGNIIGPKVLGDSTGLSAFWVVFAILLFGGLWGFMGMLIGVPTFAALYYILKQIINHCLRQKGLSTNWKDYEGAELPEPAPKTEYK